LSRASRPISPMMEDRDVSASRSTMTPPLLLMRLTMATPSLPFVESSQPCSRMVRWTDGKRAAHCTSAYATSSQVLVLRKLRLRCASSCPRSTTTILGTVVAIRIMMNHHQISATNAPAYRRRLREPCLGLILLFGTGEQRPISNDFNSINWDMSESVWSK